MSSKGSIWGPAMTDAAVPVTQSAVERFTEQYLTSVGYTIEKRGNEWDVTIPENADTDLSNNEFTILCGDHSAELDDAGEPLYPGSAFFQRILTEATDRIPTGKISVPSENTRVRLPSWLQQSSLDVTETTFMPYYDRTAAVFLFRVAIETVSEYQTESLRTIAVDVRSMDLLPELEETFLKLTSPEGEPIDSEPAEIEADRFDELVAHTREMVLERVFPEIDEVHQEASRAADAELEEYRQMRQQRIEELEEQLSTLSSRITKLSDSIQQDGNQAERVQSLKKRKELKNETEEIESKLTEIRRRREQGFPDKQLEIRERHALEVVVTPVTMTQVEYERGDVEFELSDGAATRTLTVGYGSGIGVTEDLDCDSCGRQFSEGNPVEAVKNGIQCQDCYR